MFEHKAVKLVERELLNLKLLVKLKTRTKALHYLKWLYFEVSDAWSDIGAFSAQIAPKGSSRGHGADEKGEAALLSADGV